MKDFSIAIYKKLLSKILEQDYSFQTYDDFLTKPKSKVINLRHDVDLLPQNSLKFARIQNEFGIKGTYYFRIVPKSWDQDIIQEISNLGHEIGYHYECLTTCKGDFNNSIRDFKNNLEKLRALVPVSTICMHGSPMSKYDSKDLWKEFSYRDYDIIGEPYLDTNFDEVFYLTDTGRRWNGDKVSVRDKVNQNFNLSFHTTFEIIEALKRKQLPNQIMMTFHPQRWHDNSISWTKELLVQNVKNTIKKYFFVKTE